MKLRARDLRWRIVVAIVSVGALALGPSVTANADAPLPSLTMTQAPYPIGATAVGSTAEISVGQWSPNTNVYTYSWMRDGVPISGATSERYVLTSADEGQFLSVALTAFLTGYQPTSYTVAYGLITGPDRLPSLQQTSNPVVSGAIKQGVTISYTAPTFVQTGVTTYYQWESASGDSAISTAPVAYTPTAVDATGWLYLRYWAVSPGYAGTTTELTLGPVLPITFASVNPTITGSQLVGSTLTAHGNWNATPDSVSYQWLSDGLEIEGATSSTYVTEASDIGNDIEVQMEAQRSGYSPASANATTNFTVAVAFSSTPKPTITGTAQVSSPLTAHPGDWGEPNTTFSYAWYAGTTVMQVGGATYYPNYQTIGEAITVVVTGTAPGFGPSSSAASDPTADVLVLPDPILTVKIPSEVEVGDDVQPTVTYTNPNIGGSDTYVWMLNGVPVANNDANPSVYIPQIADLGKTLSVEVAIGDPSYNRTPVSSNTETVKEGFVKGAVSVVGTMQVGSTVHAVTSGWPATATNFRYAWVPMYDRGTIFGQPVSTSSTFTIPASLVGTELSVWVQASAPDYLNDESAGLWWNSIPTVVQRADFTSTAAPTISGLAKVGAKLVASHGSLSPATGDLFRYQWYSATTSGGTYTPIAGATSSSYVPTAAMGGRFLEVRVTVTRTAYETLVVFSPASQAVIPVIVGHVAKPVTISHDPGRTP